MILKIAYKLLVQVLLIIAPVYGFSQNFNVIHDFDSTDDWGTNIFYKNDSNLLITGEGFKSFTKGTYYSTVISPNGKSIISKNSYQIDSGSVFNGYRGRAKRLPNGNYLTPFSILWPKPNNPKSIAISPGYGIFDSNGKMIFHKTFDGDTACCDQQITDCIVMPDKGYLLGGDYYDRVANTQKGCLIKTDSNGNMLWRKLYAYYYPWSYYFTRINSMQLISNNRMVVGAMYDDLVSTNPYINFDRPWFLLMDTAGNVLRDTAYRFGFAGMGTMGGGNIFKDINGGYYHYGQLATVFNSQHIDFVCNYPDYLAHLDDSFKITWLVSFPDSPGHKYIWTVRQLHDNSYLVMCGRATNQVGPQPGWAAKISSAGNVIWDNSYYFDTAAENVISDGIELPDRSIVFTGSTRDFTLPTWRSYDMWLLKIDSNGCEIPGCIPTKIQQDIPISTDIIVYPNPATNQLFIENIKIDSRLLLCDIYGRVVYSGISTQTKLTIELGNIATGTYILQVIDKDGSSLNKKVLKE